MKYINMEIGSEEEDDYGYMAHGEGESLEQYPVLPGIPSSSKPTKKKIYDTNIKMAASLSVLPPIATERSFIPSPPSCGKQVKTRRRRVSRKSPSELTEADLNPATQFKVLPQIKKEDRRAPTTHSTKKETSSIPVKQSTDVSKFYKVLPSIASNNVDVLKFSSSTQNLVELQAELSQIRNDIIQQDIALNKSITSLDSTSEEIVINYANYTEYDTLEMYIESGIQRVQSRKAGGRVGGRSGGRKLKESTLTSQDFESATCVPAPPKVAKQDKTHSKEDVKLRESGYASIYTKFNSGGM